MKHKQNRREGYRQEYYGRRRANGWCPICPNEVNSTKYAYCLACRVKRARKRNQKYRAVRRFVSDIKKYLSAKI